MDGATASQMPESQVNGLIQQVADQHALNVQGMLGDASTLAAPEARQTAAPAAAEEDSLANRLAALHG